jgi:predicted PurR-regulated permease PerM
VARYTRAVQESPDPVRRVEVTISTRTMIRVLLTATAFLVLILLLWEVRAILQLVLIAAFLALALNPIVTVLERRIGNRRGVASVLVVLGVLVLLLLFLAALLTPLYEEMRGFATRAPQLIDELRNWGVFKRFDDRYNLVQRFEEAAQQYSGRLPAQAGNLLGVATAVVTGLGKALTVLFMTLFLLLEIPRFLRATTELLRPGAADRSLVVFDQVNGTIARWTAGVLFIATIAGTVTGVTAWFLGVPFALALALLVGVLDVIPLVGATIGSIVAVLVALTHSVTAGIVMLVLAVVYQFVENHIIQPVVMRKSIDVSPFIVIVAVLIGASLLGIIGALLAIPVAGSVQVVLRQVLEARRSRVAAERQLMLDLDDGTVIAVEGDSS